MAHHHVASALLLILVIAADAIFFVLILTALYPGTPGMIWKFLAHAAPVRPAGGI